MRTPRLFNELADQNAAPQGTSSTVASTSLGYNLQSRHRTSSTAENPTDLQGSCFHALSTYMSAQSEPIYNVVATILTQYNIKQGIRFFGDKARAAVIKEMKQLYDRRVIIPPHCKDLTPEQKMKKVLEYLMTNPLLILKNAITRIFSSNVFFNFQRIIYSIRKSNYH